MDQELSEWSGDLREEPDGRRRVILAGYYGYNNAGDEAILSGILAELNALDLDLEIIVISGDPESTRTLHQVDSVSWKDLPGMIEALRSASLVSVGGGGLIQDYWGVDETSFLTLRQGGITEYGSPILLAKLFAVPCMFYAVGVGPLLTPDGRKYARLLFEVVDKASVRDRGSYELLKEIGVEETDIAIVHDPAFHAPPVELNPAFLQLLEHLPRPLIAASLRYWAIDVQPEHWQPKISRALDQILEITNGTIVFLPFHVSGYYLEDDLNTCIKIQAGMTRVEQTRLARGDWDSLQRFSALTHFDLVVGMRLHSLIAALREGVPCVGVQYDPKVGAFLEGMGLGKYAIDLQDFDPQGLVDRVLDAYEKREYFKQIAKGFWRNTTATTESAMMAKDLLEKPRSTPTFPPFLVDFTVQQTLNVSHSEEEKIRLNDLFRRIWEDRLDPNFHYEMAWTDLNWIETQLRSDHERMAVLVRENREALERSQIFQEESERLAKENREIEQRLAMENSQRMDAEETLRQVQSDSWQLREELSRIENSRGFKVLRFLWGILWRIRDPKQQILEFKVFLAKVGSWVAGRTRGFRSWIYRTFKGILPAWLRYLNFVLNIHHLILEDRSTVVLYTDEEQLFAGYQLRKRIKDMRTQPVRVTLVTTMKDEADNAQSWLEDLEHQTRPPDEVILVDGGSSDRTLEILESFAAKSSLDVKVLSKPGSNIAAGRNLGIELASHPLIAVTDFGCTLKVDWLEKLLVPFGGDPEMEVVAGWYEAFADSRIGESAKHELIPTLKHITPDTFLPATRSIAFRKTAWEEVGGFPEWLTITGEDTYFDLQLKRNCNRWAFVPDARVIWHSPKTVREIWKKLSNWTAGDGESGAFVHQYWTFMGDYFWSSFFTLLGLAIAVASFWIHPLLGAGFIFIWCLIIFLSLSVSSDHRKGAVQGFWKRFGRAARVNGFLRGIRNRQRVALRRYDGVRGVVFLLSGVPIDDTGGGARGTQITLELLQRGYLVIFVHKYPKQESVDLRIDFDQPNLLHFALKDFDWKAICWEHRLLLKSKPVTTILEFPFKEYLPFVKSTRRMGGTVIYDLIDDWNTSLGGDWYSVKTEQAIINASDVLAASAPSLVERLQHASGRRDVLWVPNAVNLRLFDRESSQPCPEDLPCGSPRILYIGALWGEWFDWDLLQKIARAYPQAAVTIIGDYRGHCPFNEPNLHFLGLKPQTSLPAYLRHSDVAIIPWEISPITQSTSPLKVFEYLAMGVPVVAPKLNPLEGIPYVFLARDHDEFIENIERACSCVIENEILDEFVEKNSWRARMDTLAEQVPHLREGEL